MRAIVWSAVAFLCITAGSSVAVSSHASKEENAAISSFSEIDYANRILSSDYFRLGVPDTMAYQDVAILGQAEASPRQAIHFILNRNPSPKLNTTVEELVYMYYEEAAHEGIRADLALSQAILETGFFGYGGDVIPEQNNYAGIGTTGGGVKGHWFSTPREGVRAHIQHLLVYTSDRLPHHAIVDPRFHLVQTIPSIYAKCTTLYSLNGKWAVPGTRYGQKIEKILWDMKTFPVVQLEDTSPIHHPVHTKKEKKK